MVCCACGLMEFKPCSRWLFHYILITFVSTLVPPNQVCQLFHDLTTLICDDKLVRCRNLLFRTTIVICKFLGTLLRFIPWNLCAKMYLRIGEATNPGPSPGHRSKQLDSSGRAFQTVQFVTANVVSMVDKAPWFNSFDHE